MLLILKMLTKRCYICRKFKFCVFLNHGSPENVKINRVVEDLLIYYIYIYTVYCIQVCDELTLSSPSLRLTTWCSQTISAAYQALVMDSYF